MSRHRQPATCEHKRRYDCWHDARRHARELRRRYHRYMREWRCKRHDCFHVGSVDRIGRAR